MPIPATNTAPPFTVTRASHTVLRARNFEASRRFYVEVIGLVVSADEGDTLYLRGVEESAHHSLVLKRTDGEPVCERLGFRVASDADLDHAKAYFDAKGIAATFVDVPHQGRTLHVADSVGTPLEFVAHMPVEKRLHDRFDLQRGGAALRLDHFQVLAPDVVEASRFYTDIGFRISDYFVNNAEDTRPLGIFLYRKNNPHDIVFLTRPGPVMHHFAYIVYEPGQMFRALDVAGHIGFGDRLERGPGRHGEGHALYVYFRDPDGHRVEIMPPPIQIGDADDTPMGWHRGNRHSWEFPAPKSWLYETSRFADTPVVDSPSAHHLLSLEEFLDRRNAVAAG